MIAAARRHIGQIYRTNGDGGWTLGPGNSLYTGGVQNMGIGVDCKDFVTIAMIETGHTADGVGVSHFARVVNLHDHWRNHHSGWDEELVWDHYESYDLSAFDRAGNGYLLPEASIDYPLVATSPGKLNPVIEDKLTPGDIIIFGDPYGSHKLSPHTFWDAHAAIYTGKGMVIGANYGGVGETPLAWLGQNMTFYQGVPVPAVEPSPGDGDYPPAVNGDPTAAGEGTAQPAASGYTYVFYPYGVTAILHNPNLPNSPTSNTLPPPLFGAKWTAPTPPVTAAAERQSVYYSLSPVTVANTSDGTGLVSRIESNLPATFKVAGANGIPSSAQSVTGILTVTALPGPVASGVPMVYPTGSGSVYLGAVPIANPSPTDSTISFSAGDAPSVKVSVPLSTSGTLSATYFGTTAISTADLKFEVTGYSVQSWSASTYHPLTPTRILDTRPGTFNVGLSGAFSAKTARTLDVVHATDLTGTPVDIAPNATAVTGNLTVTQQTGPGALYIGPNPNNDPGSSTLNFPLGDDRANNVTVALSTAGTVSITYIADRAKTAHVIFDLTGYFTPDKTGATYHPVTPGRILDTRPGSTHVGTLTGSLNAKTSYGFQVVGAENLGHIVVVPSDKNVVAVTGNLTVTQQTAAGSLYIGPNDPPSGTSPTTSTLNFPAGDNRANGVTVKLSAMGTLSITYTANPGNTAHVIFDVTGYYTPDESGATYHPLAPARILDTRSDPRLNVGLTGPIDSNASGTYRPTTFRVEGVGAVPANVPNAANAVAVTGNLTVTNATGLGSLYVGPDPVQDPDTSTLNFPAGDNRANGVTVRLSETGTLSITYDSDSGMTTDAIFDVTGYFSAMATTKLVVSGFQTPVTAGTTGDITVTAVDASGGTAWFYRGKIQFTSTDPDAVLPSGWTFAEADRGVHTFTSGVMLKKAGQQAVSAADIAPHSSIAGSQQIVVTPAALDHLVVSPKEATVAATVTQAYTASGADVFGNTIGDVTSAATFTIDGPGTCDGSSCASSAARDYTVTATDGAASGTANLHVVAGGATHFEVSGFPSPSTAGVPATLTVRALDAWNNVAKDYTGKITFTTSDSAHKLPDPHQTLADGVGTFNVTLGTMGTYWVAVNDEVTPSITGRQENIVVNPTDGAATYHPVTPTRLLNTRTGVGLSGPLGVKTPRPFKVAGVQVVPTTATAVTGSLTVSGATGVGYLYIGPDNAAVPTTSNLNFPAGDNRSNEVTVQLTGSGSPCGPGYLYVTYVADTGKATHAIFDVTGYFTPDMSGATYHPVTPGRILDTRSGSTHVGTLTGPLNANTSFGFKVVDATAAPTGSGIIPVPADKNVVAVTGNVTVTGQSAPGSLYLGSQQLNSPSTSVLNSPVGDTRASGVTVGLSAGQLYVTYMATAGSIQVIFDVTGYFTQDWTGAVYSPVTPTRFLDTRSGVGSSGALLASNGNENHSRPFQVTGAIVPTTATAVTGNLTVTQQTAGGYLYIGPSNSTPPPTSTLSFPAGDNRCSAGTVKLTASGSLYVTYVAVSGKIAHAIFDVTGYYVQYAP